MHFCDLCQQEFQNKSNFNRHIKRFHPTKDELDYYETDASDNDEDDNMEDAVEEDGSDNSDTESDNSDTEDSSKNELEIDIWNVIDQEASTYEDGDLSEAVKMYILLCRSLKKDSTVQAIMETLRKAKEEHNMHFTEALDYAVDKRKFLIQQTWKEWKAEKDKKDMSE